jgi:hypothetical protein
VFRWFQSRALPARDTEGRITGIHVVDCELENFIERSVILTRGTALQAPIAELGNNGKRLRWRARAKPMNAMRLSAS